LAERKCVEIHSNLRYFEFLTTSGDMSVYMYVIYMYIYIYIYTYVCVYTCIEKVEAAKRNLTPQGKYMKLPKVITYYSYLIETVNPKP
jgi:hypothetical protein